VSTSFKIPWAKVKPFTFKNHVAEEPWRELVTFSHATDEVADKALQDEGYILAPAEDVLAFALTEASEEQRLSQKKYIALMELAKGMKLPGQRVNEMIQARHLKIADVTTILHTQIEKYAYEKWIFKGNFSEFIAHAEKLDWTEEELRSYLEGQGFSLRPAEEILRKMLCDQADKKGFVPKAAYQHIVARAGHVGVSPEQVENLLHDEDLHYVRRFQLAHPKTLLVTLIAFLLLGGSFLLWFFGIPQELWLQEQQAEINTDVPAAFDAQKLVGVYEGEVWDDEEKQLTHVRLKVQKVEASQTAGQFNLVFDILGKGQRGKGFQGKLHAEKRELDLQQPPGRVYTFENYQLTNQNGKFVFQSLTDPNIKFTQR